MIADYDTSEPKYVPIVVSIVFTIILIILITGSLIIYFKSAISQQEKINEVTYGNSLELKTLRAWEEKYLNISKKDKVTIDEAINITNYNYRN